MEQKVPTSGGGTIACVIEDHPRGHLEALRWFASATKLAGVDPSDLTANVVGGTSTEVVRYLSAQGVTVNAISPLDPRSPRCNKIAASLRVAEQRPAGLVILTDSDVVFCEDPRKIAVEPDSVASGPLAAADAGPSLIRQVFAEAGIPASAGSSLEHPKAGAGADAGVYVIPAGLLGRFTQSWQHWARWLLDHQATLPKCSVQVDQLAAALALAAKGIAWQQLPPWWNVSTHTLGCDPAPAGGPAILQYHEDVDPTGLLLRHGEPLIDEPIELINEAIDFVFHQAFPNTTFWEWRYRANPGLGSGVGSRGPALEEKRALIKRVIATTAPDSVLDVGCGDGRAIEGIQIPHYHGLDVSAEAVRLTKARLPDATVSVGTLSQCFTTADLVICLDVLIHIADAAEYEELVRLLVKAAQKNLLVAGYEKRSTVMSPMIHFHEPLSTTIRGFAPHASLLRVRDVHEITTWLVTPQGSRPRLTFWMWPYRMSLRWLWRKVVARAARRNLLLTGQGRGPERKTG